MDDSLRIPELEAQARYHRQRYDLYRAKAYGPSDTSPVELRERERACKSAEDRLRFARMKLSDEKNQRA